MWLYSLLGLASVVVSVGGLVVLAEEVIGLTAGISGVVVIDHCDAVKSKYRSIKEWACSGSFRSSGKAAVAIEVVSIYLDKDDLRARPGLTVNARVAGSAASVAVVPGRWGTAVGFLIESLGFAWLSWWSIYTARRVRRAARDALPAGTDSKQRERREGREGGTHSSARGGGCADRGGSSLPAPG